MVDVVWESSLTTRPINLETLYSTIKRNPADKVKKFYQPQNSTPWKSNLGIRIPLSLKLILLRIRVVLLYGKYEVGHQAFATILVMAWSCSWFCPIWEWMAFLKRLCPMLFHDYWSLLNEAKPTLAYMGKHQVALADLRENHHARLPSNQISRNWDSGTTWDGSHTNVFNSLRILYLFRTILESWLPSMDTYTTLFNSGFSI